MFRHRGVIHRESTKTKKHKSSTQIQVLIALTVFIRILKIKILEYTSLTSMNSHCCDTQKFYDGQPLQVQARSRLYFVGRMYTNI